MDDTKIAIPDWWFAYKKSNPDDTDEYDPMKHCCSTFWKDFCQCFKSNTKARKETNVKETIDFLKKQGVQFTHSNIDNVVIINHNNSDVYVSLKKHNGLIKCQFHRSGSWYTYSEPKFIETFKKSNN